MSVGKTGALRFARRRRCRQSQCRFQPTPNRVVELAVPIEFRCRRPASTRPRGNSVRGFWEKLWGSSRLTDSSNADADLSQLGSNALPKDSNAVATDRGWTPQSSRAHSSQGHIRWERPRIAFRNGRRTRGERATGRAPLSMESRARPSSVPAALFHEPDFRRDREHDAKVAGQVNRDCTSSSPTRNTRTGRCVPRVRASSKMGTAWWLRSAIR